MAIPTPIIRNLSENGILRTMAIDLSETPEDRAAIIEVLRSKVYSDKVLAPIREYSTNGADSHVEAGCPDRPLKVVLPTPILPELRIRDFGTGLTVDEVESTFIKYGRSSKRGTNAQTGQLGLGCKAAFAYGDNFILISYKNGIKTTYNLTISGVCSVLAEESMEEGEENGIEIIVPVLQSDVFQFQTKAIEFFKYWKVCPEISGGDLQKLEYLREQLAQKPLFSAEDWEIRPKEGYYSENGIAVMGNIPYPINWSIVRSKINFNSDEKRTVLFDFISSNKAILRFNIGDLDFSASRESLEYTDKTCNGIVAKVESILENIFSIINDKIQNAPSYWESLIIYNQIFGRDDEKIFQGEMYKLESYYKGKLFYNNIPINSGYIDINFDYDLGYSPDGKYTDVNGKTLYCNKSVLSGFTIKKRNNRISEENYRLNRIPANKNTKILIYDLEVISAKKKVVRWLFNQPNTSSSDLSKIYCLEFKNEAQKQEFFQKTNFDSVPVIYASQIIDKVKADIKAARIAKGGNTVTIREPVKVRRFVPMPQINRFGHVVQFERIEENLREIEGFYIPMEDDSLIFTGKTSHCNNLSLVSSYIYSIAKALDETIGHVYAITPKTYESKWFKEAVEDGQWVNIEEYIKENGHAVHYGKGSLISKSGKFVSAFSSSAFTFGYKFAEHILPLLNNKNGVMYQLCSEISSEFEELSNLANAMEFFNIPLPEDQETDINYVDLFTKVEMTYPMLMKHINYKTFRTLNLSINFLSYTETIKEMADYINLVDNTNCS